nr:MAG: hypothetical protein [Barnaviridae sp.]
MFYVHFYQISAVFLAFWAEAAMAASVASRSIEEVLRSPSVEMYTWLVVSNTILFILVSVWLTGVYKAILYIRFQRAVKRASRVASIVLKPSEVNGEICTDSEGVYVRVKLDSGKVYHIRTGGPVPLGHMNFRAMRPQLEALTGAALISVDKAPTGVVTFINKVTRCVVGMGSRVMVGKKSYLLTANHVLDAMRNSGADNFVMSTLEKEADVCVDWTVEVRSPTSSFDFSLLNVPESTWAGLGVKALKIFQTPRIGHGQVYGIDGSNWSTSYSSIKAVPDQPGHIRHSCSTLPGWSGSPIVSKGGVIGIHLGAVTLQNKGVSLNFILGRNESDQPAWAWKEFARDDDEEWERRMDRADAENLGEASVVYMVDSAFLVNPRGNGAYSRQRVEVPDMEYHGAGRAWADYDDDEEDFGSFGLESSEATGFWTPDFQSVSPSPARVRPSRTSRATSGKLEPGKNKASSSKKQDTLTSLEALVSQDVAHRLSPSYSSPASTITDGQEPEPRPNVDPSCTTAPSTKKEKSRRRKPSKPSKLESAPPIPTQSRPKPSTKGKERACNGRPQCKCAVCRTQT